MGQERSLLVRGAREGDLRDAAAHDGSGVIAPPQIGLEDSVGKDARVAGHSSGFLARAGQTTAIADIQEAIYVLDNIVRQGHEALHFLGLGLLHLAPDYLDVFTRTG